MIPAKSYPKWLKLFPRAWNFLLKTFTLFIGSQGLSRLIPHNCSPKYAQPLVAFVMMCQDQLSPPLHPSSPLLYHPNSQQGTNGTYRPIWPILGLTSKHICKQFSKIDSLPFDITIPSSIVTPHLCFCVIKSHKWPSLNQLMLRLTSPWHMM